MKAMVNWEPFQRMVMPWYDRSWHFRRQRRDGNDIKECLGHNLMIWRMSSTCALSTEGSYQSRVILFGIRGRFTLIGTYFGTHAYAVYMGVLYMGTYMGLYLGLQYYLVSAASLRGFDQYGYESSTRSDDRGIL